ncbi:MULTISPECIES: helix-turn-helix transcriptional regulator [Paraburkholderia]|uniref:LuxR family transcriptional regulator n=1 Tax=Paraburkholderia tropica TaxID=92647 RepID=A0A1A5XLZ8_9BURK|nr:MULTISPECIES: helix-turn-helix transcriptional regulator [Paraburkholderia]MBB2978505.1 DNA-binding CsgD family transcriptional regulator [Paraburkholderia tropica]MBB2998699.1 DNA-binding CsgD family transcriptional regulator [Paraburkholderia tropica]MBB6318526.1 DNA-binding CsgD family transcriptional regulator [Paraburkholderia tropica]MDE1139444.1 helix-turn-helix transcriptional regulator [Paraburkholderia tropica]OBR54447.1 helix-turn-helix transcriptional regulator [Paraburkholderia
MEPDWQDRAFHHHIATLIDALDGPDFWTRATRVIERFVAFDNWVALVFVRDRAPLVCAESPMPDGTVDLLFRAYLEGMYQLDPFYINACERPRAGLITLAEVAPDNFRMTDYYQRYFKSNIIGDEVQFNVPLDARRTLIFSLGAKHHYTERDVAQFAMFAPWVIALMRQRLAYEPGVAADEAAGAPQSDAVAERAAAEVLELDYARRFEAVTQQSGRTPLTAREVEVVRQSLSGFSTRAIAERLEISFETVRAHKKHIYAKLGVSSQSELFALFYEPNGREGG